MTAAPRLAWAFRILVAVNAVLLAAAFLYRSPGEDAAGEGLRLGFAVVYAVALAAVLLLHRFVAVAWVRAALLVALAVPLLAIGYGVWLSL